MARRPPPRVASAPRNLTATAGEASVALAWQVPTSDGGGSISGYRVYRSTSPAGAGSELATLGSVRTTPTPRRPRHNLLLHRHRSELRGRRLASNEALATPLAPMVEIPGVRGNWVGNYGSDGYALFAWTASTDLVLVPSAIWPSSRDAQRERRRRATCAPWRARISPSGARRRLPRQPGPARLTFPGCAYAGTLHLYAVDWTTTARRERITVNDGSGARVASLTSSFNAGAWLHFPVSVPAGGSVSITVDRVAGANACSTACSWAMARRPPPPWRRRRAT